MILEITDNLREVVESIDYDAITFAEIKQKLEIAIEDLERLSSELDGYESDHTLEDDLPY